MKVSIYSYLFNAEVRGFNLDETINNFTSFADEVVIATVSSEDRTYEKLLSYQDLIQQGRLKIKMTDIKIKGNNRFDGDLKTAALSACSHPVRIIADCDERFIFSQRGEWDNLASQLLSDNRIDGYLIPVIDLYKDRNHIRNQTLGLKFRIHKDTVKKRGVPQFAERGGGLFDTNLSDSTEPLLDRGQLATFVPAYPNHYLHPSVCHLLDDKAYVIHEGFLDLARRAELGKTFWKQHWEARSGREENVATKMEDLLDVPLVPHRLRLK